MAFVHSLGYVGVGISDIEAWKRYATEVVGLQIGEELADGTVILRADAYKRRLVLHPTGEDDLLYVGWEVNNRTSLDALRDKLKSADVPFTEGGLASNEARDVLELIRFRDADGNIVEAFYGPTELQHDPFRPAAGGGFITGDQGLGHVVLFADNYPAQIDFYQQVLGFSLSDTVNLSGTLAKGGQPHATFLHVNPRHHSLALTNKSLGKRFGHLMLQVASIDDVGYARERAKRGGAPILVELGRHSNDRMFSFYMGTPSGWTIEYGTGAITIDDPGAWHVTHHPAPSCWGHDRKAPA
jgi:2,3-dihydroxybiphenyl 1,2-dioxygenase